MSRGVLRRCDGRILVVVEELEGSWCLMWRLTLEGEIVSVASVRSVEVSPTSKKAWKSEEFIR